MRKYLIAPVAEQDIDEIISFIAEDNPRAALKILDNLYEAMDRLAEHPLIGHAREDLTNRPVRFWPVISHYLIIYKATSPIEIVRVLSGYRDIADLLI